MKYRSHGIERKKKQTKNTFINYYQDNLGYNYRMNDIQAALGLSQLTKVKKFINKRKKIAKFYFKNLNSKLFTIPTIEQINNSTNHLFVARVKYFNKKINRDTYYNFLTKKGIGVNIHYIPLHYHPYIKRLLKNKNFKNSEKYYSEAISLPIHPELTKKDLSKIINKINSFNKKI
jgi:perosamine synthetase